MAELKNCPFCNGKVILGRGIEGEITGILCPACKAHVKFSNIKMRGKETFGENQAKWEEAWNRRAAV